MNSTSDSRAPSLGSLPPTLCELASKQHKSQAEKGLIAGISLLGTHPWYESMSPEAIYSLLLQMADRSHW